jgi:phosphoglycolate phosphatase
MAALASFLLDLDGTLVDSARGIANALTQLANARGLPAVMADVVRPLVSRGVETLVGTTLGSTSADLAADVAAFRQVLAGLPADPDALYPGAFAAVSGLHTAGHPIAIVTNKPERLALGLLDQLGLLALCGAVVGGDTCPRAKPDPQPLLHALARIAPAARPGDAIMVGDSDVDGQAALTAGCRFLLFTGGYGPVTQGLYPVARRFSGFDQLEAFAASLRHACCVATA